MNWKVILPVGAFAVAGACAADAQTAVLPVQISGFVGVSGSYTGLETSRNLGVTGGVDVALRSFFGITPGLEVRGTYPVADGLQIAERNILGGLRLSKRYSLLRPYVDFLYGRGQVNYLSGGIESADGTFFYNQTTSNVISPGLGVDVDLVHHLGLKGDFQLQRYASPAVVSGNLNAKVFTLGVVYRLGF